MTSKTKLMQKIDNKRRNLNLSKGEFARIELEISKQKFLSWQNGSKLTDQDKVKLLEYLIDN